MKNIKNIVIKIIDKEFNQLLNVDLKLSKVRIFILKNPKIRSHIRYPENTLIFQHNNINININKESKALSEILVGNECNELFITFTNNEPADVSFQIEEEKHFEELPLNMKLDELIESCEFGFNLTTEGTKKAPRKAITIHDPRTEKSNPRLTGFVKECNNERENLYGRNIVFGGKILSPLLSFGMDLKKSIGFEKKLDTATSYSIQKSEYASIEFTESNYYLKPEFENDVESAVNPKLSLEEKRKKLEEIIENYGQFISKKIVFGGKIIKQRTSEANKVGVSSSNTKGAKSNINPLGIVSVSASANKTKSVNDITRSSKTESFEHTIGGKKSARLDDWYESLRDPDQWDIIEYNDITPIFEILPDDLKEQVLKIFGQKILDVKTCRIIYDTEKKKNKAYVHKLEHDIPDIENTRVEYIGKKSPAIVIHKINKDKSRDKHYLKISYMIIGYGFRSKLGLDVKFIGEEKQIKRDNNRFIAEIERPTNEGSIIGSCVIKSYQHPTNPEDSKIISLHFHPSDKKVCIHTYDLNTKEIIEPPLNDCYIHYSAFEFSGSGEPYGKTRLTFNYDKKFFKINKNSMWIKYDNCTQNQSIFMNLIFDCTNNQHEPVAKSIVNVVFNPNVIFSAPCENTCISGNDSFSFFKIMK
ncbi:22260_t:CDS:2 [Entrophospora sp. SA101]|nr:22260_t:CDS:2 [Entrophospora sp. SA101]CAJ0919348.1 1014_t:CDS:2 [Entrophospora sp. SA101]